MELPTYYTAFRAANNCFDLANQFGKMFSLAFNYYI